VYPELLATRPEACQDIARLSSQKGNHEWRLADAKNRFSELVNRALAEGPQRVLRRDDAVVVVAERDYQELTGKRQSFKEFLLGKGPSLEGLDLARDRSPMRETKP
jgi:antitoxin Phd